MDDFPQALCAARKKAGLSQADCAHLLDVSTSRISRLETGAAIPSVDDLCAIALVFGRPMESLSGTLFSERAKAIKERLFDLPEPHGGFLTKFNRNNALERLSDRLERITELYGGR